MHPSLTLLSGGLLASLCMAAPVVKRDIVAPAGGDIDILNYALTLEYLERKFYMEGLNNYTEDDFTGAGFTKELYANLHRVYEDEKTHVNFLAAALGKQAIGEPTFSFPVSDVRSFVGLSAVLEGVGVSAYLGAAPVIANKNYLAAAGSILTVEARHAAYIRAALGQKPFPTAFDTPLDFNQVFSLAAQFVTGFAPNTKIPFKAFPSLTATAPDNGGYYAGKSVVTFKNAYSMALNSGKIGMDTKVFAVFYSGLETYYVPVQARPECDDYTVQIPGADFATTGQPAPAGQTYVTLSTADGTMVTASDENTIAGVAVLEIEC